MRLVPYLTTFLLTAAAALAPGAHGADAGRTPLVPDGAARAPGATREPVTVRAILVIASDAGTTDESLAQYEANLRRILRFDAYRRVGGGTAKIAVGKSGAIALGAGQRLAVQIENAWNNQVMAAFKWWNGDLNLANTSMQRPRGSHTVLSGPATADGDGYYAVIIVVE